MDESRVREAIELLEQLSGDAKSLAELPDEVRTRLVTAAGQLSRPDRYVRKALRELKVDDRVRKMMTYASFNSNWRMLDEKGKPYWVNSDETLTRQPARGTGQRVMEVLLGIFPKEQY